MYCLSEDGFDYGEPNTLFKGTTPWSGQIVSQTKTENIKGVQMFSDQMPVAVELHNGRIALALETRLDRVPNFRISISHSDDNWATALEPFKDVGPATKLTKYCIGAGPYIGQFESGETVVSYNRKNNLTFIVGNALAILCERLDYAHDS